MRAPVEITSIDLEQLFRNIGKCNLSTDILVVFIKVILDEYILTQAHAQIHTHGHTHAHTSKQASMHTNTHGYTHAHTSKHARTHAKNREHCYKCSNVKHQQTAFLKIVGYTCGILTSLALCIIICTVHWYLTCPICGRVCLYHSQVVT